MCWVLGLLISRGMGCEEKLAELEGMTGEGRIKSKEQGMLKVKWKENVFREGDKDSNMLDAVRKGQEMI